MRLSTTTSYIASLSMRFYFVGFVDMKPFGLCRIEKQPNAENSISQFLNPAIDRFMNLNKPKETDRNHFLVETNFILFKVDVKYN